jgi:AAA domain
VEGTRSFVIEYGLNAIVYGNSKQGKSWMGDTTPAPRLVLDAESGSRFTPSKKVQWNPSVDAPPKYDGTWDTAIVPVRQYRDIDTAYAWLNAGKHDFKSVVLDSISEIQQRAVDSIAGANLMKTHDWGTLLRTVSDMVRKFRDLVTNPVKPLDAVIYIAMAKQRQDGVWAPYVQGGLATVLPFYVDLCCYLTTVQTEDGAAVRRLFIENVPGYEVGQRVGGRLPQFIDNPSITDMLNMIRNGN